MQFGARERIRPSRIRDLSLPTEAFKLCSPALPNFFEQAPVAVTHKILNRGCLSVLLPHEEQGDKWRQKHEACNQLLGFKADHLRKPVALGAVPDLIVILAINNELIAGRLNRGASMTTLTK